MANLFGFDLTCGMLGHYIKLHIESNTLFKWFDYEYEYSEEDNSLKIFFELLKVQLCFIISSNIQDVFNFVNTSFFVRQDHNLLSEDDILDSETAKIIDEIE